ncbi:hypothetical protein L9F63_017082 [Diploptera punctata]|uniref:Leucine-rich repeat and WD repeat-containing protein 1 WD domain-containing protein n=1 Tax=Diploptera punctata TaxID=6984 RepID=A0AAD8A080_DIPPU|nr:hypothetical protein L9F63_017082 [Diploptera punctata]
MKRKLENEKLEENLNYEPTHFLRCHSRNNDPADIRTQVWLCAFEPNPEDPQKTTRRFATCAGNSICIINAKTGTVQAKYNADDIREMFYTIAWTTLVNLLEDTSYINILACGGARGTIHLIHPSQGIAFLEQRVVKSVNVNISSLLFHPKKSNVLFCALSDGQVLTWDVTYPLSPNFTSQLVPLITLESHSEIFALAFSTQQKILLAACNNGLRGWNISHQTLEQKKDKLHVLIYHAYHHQLFQKDEEMELVDSVEVVTDTIVATKCALHGFIYLWDLKATLASASKTVVLTHKLKWSDTDNYFMGIGLHREAQLLACGDDRGTIWLYDLKTVLEQTRKDVEPSMLLQWPEVRDKYLDHKRKLNLGVYDIVIDKVAVNWNGKYLVAVTNNNMVCIWQRS